MSQIPIFLINLERSVQRKKQMVFQLEKLGLQYTLFPAIDGLKLDATTIATIQKNRNKKLYARPFTLGEIGCALSHLYVYKKICDDKLACALILEDDVYLEPSVRNVATFSTLACMPLQWDMLLCAYVQRGNTYSKPYKQAHLQYRHRIKLLTATQKKLIAGIPTELCFHTAGYIVSLSGAQKLYEKGNPISMPADVLTGNAHAYGIVSYALKKPCVRQHISWALDSTIKENTILVKHSYKKLFKKLLPTIFLKIYYLCINTFILTVRGHKFPMRFLRKLGILKRDTIANAI